MKIIISCLKEIEQESRVLTGQQWSALRDAVALWWGTPLTGAKMGISAVDFKSLVLNNNNTKFKSKVTQW